MIQQKQDLEPREDEYHGHSILFLIQTPINYNAIIIIIVKATLTIWKGLQLILVYKKCNYTKFVVIAIAAAACYSNLEAWYTLYIIQVKICYSFLSRFYQINISDLEQLTVTYDNNIL